MYPPWPGASLFDGVISSVRWEAARAGLEDAECFMMLLDRVTMLRTLCRFNPTLPSCQVRNGTSNQAAAGGVWTVVDDAIEALKRVDEVVWDFPECGWVALPVTERRWNISEPYTHNISLVHEVLDGVGVAIERVDRALAVAQAERRGASKRKRLQ